MRKWWKPVGIMAGGLVGLMGLGDRADAQFPGAGPPPGVFAADPQAPCPPDFPNGAPRAPAGDQASPFTVRDDGMPNAFTELDAGTRGPDPYRFDVRVEYLRWHVERNRLSTELVTTTTGTPDLFVNNGALGSASTQVLLGPGAFDYHEMHGGRATVGIAPYYLPPIELTGLWLTRDQTLLSAFSNGQPGSQLITRPIQTADIVGQLNFPAEDVSFVAVPGLLAGGISVTSAFSLWGMESNFVIPIGASDVLQVYAIAGYRHMDLLETLDFRSTYSPLEGAFVNFLGDPVGFGAGNVVNVNDRFRARNLFDGGQIGVRSILSINRINFWLDTKLAMGNTRHKLDVGGSSQLTAGRNAATVPGGVLALPSNSGLTTDNDFTIIPEANLNVGIQLHPNIRIFGGYNALYWNRVVRAGDQLSNRVDTRQIPTDINFVNGTVGTDPLRTLNRSSFFAHGFNVGLEIGF